MINVNAYIEAIRLINVILFDFVRSNLKFDFAFRSRIKILSQATHRIGLVKVIV